MAIPAVSMVRITYTIRGNSKLTDQLKDGLG